MAQSRELPKEIQIALSAAEQIKDREKIAAATEDAELESKQKTMAALGTIAAAGGGVTQNDLMNRALQALIANLDHDMAKKRAKEERDEEEVRRLIQARNDGLKIERAQREHTQRVCDHRKSNGATRICGQRTSDHKLALLCNLCYRTFDEFTCPPHLVPSGDVIGG